MSAETNLVNTIVGALQNGLAFFKKVGGYTLKVGGDHKMGLEASAAVTISSAEMLALNATPKTIMDAPDAGYAIVPRMIELFLDYNSAAYAGIATAEDLVIRYTGSSGAIIATIETTGFLDATADAIRIAFPDNFAPVAGAAIVAHMLTGEITTGNSPLKVRVIDYDLIKVSA